MSTTTLILSIITALASIFLIVTILLQPGKNSGIAGAISGATDTFLAKHRNNTKEAVLARLTKMIAAIFLVSILLLGLLA